MANPLFFRILCLTLHTNRGYKARLISTIVDIQLTYTLRNGYKARLISTIVDKFIFKIKFKMAIKPD